MIEAYLRDLATALRVRGRTRWRFLSECREHLEDLARETDEEGAVATFGDPTALADAFDAEVAKRRGVAAAWWTALGVVATGGSTLALIHSSDPGARAVTAWAFAFTVFAQVAAVCTALVVIHALCVRRGGSSVPDAALLCRRTICALLAAVATMFSAGAGLTGHGSALLLLAGPLLAGAAAAWVVRAWISTRRLPGASVRVDRSPFGDLRALTGLPVPIVGPAAIAGFGAFAMFVRDRGEAGSSLLGSVVLATAEAVVVLVAYAALRGPLGLRPHIEGVERS